MTPRLESVWFGGGAYARMAAVLASTVAEHAPGWRVNIERVDEKTLARHMLANQSHAAKAHALKHWNAIVQASEIGDRLLLIDADTFLVNPIDDIWNLDFDLAYTVKASKYPFNSGVVFLRVSEPVKALVSRWAEINRDMLALSRNHMPWRRRFGGINQAAFGKLLQEPIAATVNIIGVPCAEWNCEDSAWGEFDPERTRIVHVKSALRRAIFEG
jgi:hypothetical protein